MRFFRFWYLAWKSFHAELPNQLSLLTLTDSLAASHFLQLFTRPHYLVLLHTSLEMDYLLPQQLANVCFPPSAGLGSVTSLVFACQTSHRQLVKDD